MVLSTVTCTCIAESIGERMGLDEVEQKQLYYGALLHDIGMLAVPSEIIEAPRKLTKEEYEIVKQHVHTAEKMLKNRMAEEVVEIIATHHERSDGSGYPRGLKEVQMNQKDGILQVADTITALWSKRAYRLAYEEQEMMAIITHDTAVGKYNKEVVKVFVDHYQEIMKKVKVRVDETMATYRKMEKQYEQVSGKRK
jgi:putative nucleotidyltransferase with HDIG domain